MIELEQDRLLNSQVGALQECIDLCRNGYFTQVQHYAPTFWYIRLRHYHNGRSLTIWWEKGCWMLKESGKLLKRVDYPKEINAIPETSCQ